MKWFWILIIVLSGTLLHGCNSQPMPLYTPDNIGNIYSRGIITDAAIEEGSTALFNASGGISLTNQVFTFNGTNWENEGTILNIDTSQETKLTALYPAYNDEETFITESPYTEGALEDVLIAKSTFSNQTNIDLSFTHLFSMLTIHVQSPFKETLTGISVTAPKITSINPADGTFTTSGEHTTHLDKNDTGDYSFIIPSIENCNLTLTFTTAEGDIPHSLTNTFLSGYKYECNVTNSDTRPGIRTIDDLIDFSLFINGKSDKRPWSDFGIETSEGRVYRLLADLDFENKIYSNLLPIGYAYSNSSIFNDIFDGGGHTISNLIIPDKSINSNVQTNFAGLFGHIGEGGIVRNLHLDNVNCTESATCKTIGAISAKNSGKIINCTVKNSTLKSSIKDIIYIGGICARLSQGYIINCATLYNQIYSYKYSYTGGISADANGYILNCYTYENTLNTKDCTNSKNGGLVGTNSPDYKLTIANCYVNHSSLIASNSANAVGNAQYVSIDNFMYNLSTNICLTQGQNVVINNEQRYSSTTFAINDTHISTILNNWINNTDIKQTYPDIDFNIEFKYWTSTIPAVFQE